MTIKQLEKGKEIELELSRVERAISGLKLLNQETPIDAIRRAADIYKSSVSCIPHEVQEECHKRILEALAQLATKYSEQLEKL